MPVIRIPRLTPAQLREASLHAFLNDDLSAGTPPCRHCPGDDVGWLWLGDYERNRGAWYCHACGHIEKYYDP